MDAKEKTNRGGPHPTQGDCRPNADLRRNKRALAGFPIECRARNQVILGRAENISQGGVLMRTEQALPWDEVVSLSFVLPGSTETLQVRGRMAHAVAGVFMGLEFLELPPQIRVQIEQYISSVSPVSPKRS